MGRCRCGRRAALRGDQYAALSAFSYLLAGLGSGSDLYFVLFFLLCDVAGFAIWASIAEIHFGRAALLGAALLYGFNPETFGAALAGQDEPLAVLLAGVAVALLLSGKPGLSGAVSGVLVLLTKIFSGLYLTAILVASRRRWSFAAWAALVTAPILLAFAAAGADLLQPLTYEGAANERWSPGNVWFVASLAGFDVATHRHLASALLLSGMAATAVYLWRDVQRRDDLVRVAGILLLTFSILSFKSWYLTLASPFLAIAVCRNVPWGWAAVALIFVHALASLNASAWFEWLRFGSLDLVWADPLPEPLRREQILLFTAGQIAELALKFALLAWMIAPSRVQVAAARASAPIKMR